MPAPNASQEIQTIPLKMVGGTHYGRYSKISLEETWNFLVSDNALVPYAGYFNRLTLSPASPGRGIYSSFRGNLMLVVLGSEVFIIKYISGVYQAVPSTPVGVLATSDGDVFIAENNNSEIAITDGVGIYVYNYFNGTFYTQTTSTPVVFPSGYKPGYISFQNGRLIVAILNTSIWLLSAFNNALSWIANEQSTGSLQTKPDYVQAAVPTPGGGNNILVFGRNCAESWQDIGAALFPYQRSSTSSIDYGCLNPSTISTLENYVVWISVNEQSGPVLMVAQGTSVKSISTDGIDFKLGNLTAPQNCTGFLFKQDGHLIYQFTFITDNISYAYDFNTQLFFNVSDENQNYHIARQVVFFNNKYFFVSLNGGNIYQFDSTFTDATYGDDDIREIPRIRITSPFRLPSQRYFIGKSLGFTIENGEPNIRTVQEHEVFGNEELITTEAGDTIATEAGVSIAGESDDDPTDVITSITWSEFVDLSMSRDGAASFGSSVRNYMNPTGRRKSRFIYQRLGQVNDATFQLRFWGFSRFVVFDGEVEIYE